MSPDIYMVGDFGWYESFDSRCCCCGWAGVWNVNE